MPEPILTEHVRKRMASRGITEKQIRTALHREQRSTPGEPGTIWIHGLVDGGDTLKVCVPVDKSRIITAAWPD
jgi:hypothetical protein